ncbi:MAG: phosphate ABC transporter permease PstA [Planctomycetota bacterium]
MTGVSVGLLCLLLWHIGSEGARWLDWQFLTSLPSRRAAEAGIIAGLAGTVWLICFTVLFAVPIGVASAIYLEEYARPSRLNRLIQINIANLAGVPSVVYGLLGLAVFVRWFELGRSIWAGSLTMSLLILPVIIIAAREALRAVPQSLRQASFALGATRWQTVWHHVLPSGLPGILTGVILAVSRAIGETAPLIMIGVPAYVNFVPRQPGDEFSVLPMQVFNWTSKPQAEFQELAAAGIIVLLVVLLTLNASALAIRQRFNRSHR